MYVFSWGSASARPTWLGLQTWMARSHWGGCDLGGGKMDGYEGTKMEWPLTDVSEISNFTWPCCDLWNPGCNSWGIWFSMEKLVSSDWIFLNHPTVFFMKGNKPRELYCSIFLVLLWELAEIGIWFFEDFWVGCWKLMRFMLQSFSSFFFREYEWKSTEIPGFTAFGLSRQDAGQRAYR